MDHPCNRQTLFSRYNPSDGKRAEDLLEALKELSGSDVLPIEKISLNPITLRLKLKVSLDHFNQKGQFLCKEKLTYHVRALVGLKSHLSQPNG